MPPPSKAKKTPFLTEAWDKEKSGSKGIGSNRCHANHASGEERHPTEDKNDPLSTESQACPDTPQAPS